MVMQAEHVFNESTTPYFFRREGNLLSPVEGTHPLKIDEDLAESPAKASLATQEEQLGKYRFLPPESQQRVAEILNERVKLMTDSPEFRELSRELNGLHAENNRLAMEALVIQN